MQDDLYDYPHRLLIIKSLPPEKCGKFSPQGFNPFDVLGWVGGATNIVLGGVDYAAKTTGGAVTGLATGISAVVPKISVPTISIPKIEVPKIEVPKIEVPKIEVPKIEVPTVDISGMTNAISVLPGIGGITGAVVAISPVLGSVSTMVNNSVETGKISSEIVDIGKYSGNTSVQALTANAKKPSVSLANGNIYEKFVDMAALTPAGIAMKGSDVGLNLIRGAATTLFGSNNPVTGAIDWADGAKDVVANETARFTLGVVNTPASLYDLGEDIALKIKEYGDGEKFGTYTRSNVLDQWQGIEKDLLGNVGIELDDDYVSTAISKNLEVDIPGAGIKLGDIVGTLYQITTEEPVLILQPEIAAVDFVRSTPEMADLGLVVMGQSPVYTYVYKTVETDDPSLIGKCSIDGVIGECP